MEAKNSVIKAPVSNTFSFTLGQEYYLLKKMFWSIFILQMAEFRLMTGNGAEFGCSIKLTL